MTIVLAVLEEIDREINKYMGRLKRERLEKERSKLLTERLIVLEKVYTNFIAGVPPSDKELGVTAVEIFMDPSIQNIIENLPKTEKLKEEDLLPTLVEIFPDVNKRIRKSIDDQLLARLSAAYKEAGEECDLDPAKFFDLATTLFQCKSCTTHCWYNMIVAHRCTRTNSFPADFQDADIISRCLKAPRLYRTHANVKVDVSGLTYSRQALKLCGLDPSNTTRKMMDDLDPLFECLLCNQESKGRATMTWSRAVSLFPS